MNHPTTQGAPLLEPGRPGYEDAAPWNRAIPSRPAAVIGARTAADVVAAVRHAAAHDLRVAVRSSGHGATPLDDSTLLVHTRALTELTVDPVARLARIGAGVPWQPVLDAAAAHGLAAVCGSAPQIGAVGYLTGGGLGPLARTYGVSSDLVEAVEVVVGDGRVMRASPTENVDLFWGLRGGKATLGIVTAVELRLVPLDSFYGGALWFAAEDTGAVLHAWHDLCAVLPDEGTTSAAVLRLPAIDALPAPIAGKQTLAVRFGWVGSPEHAETFLRTVRRVATPVLDDVRLRPYPQIGHVHSDPVAPAAITDRSALLDELSDSALEALLEVTAPEVNRQTIVEVRHFGGAVARPGEHASAVCHRDASFGLFLSGPASGAPAVAEHGAQVRAALSAWTRPGLLPNFAASGDPEQIRRCYDADTVYWLEELGDHYDPGHVLDVGQVVRRPVS